MLREMWISTVKAFSGYGPQLMEERPWVKRWRRKRQRKKAA